MATIFKLIIEDDEGKTTVYPLADHDVSIGRRDGNTIRLMERNVSRRHARLVRNNGTVFIEDLDSYNGVRINGERISGRYEVKEGDLVEIGDYHLALQRQEVQESAPSATETVQDGGPSWPAAGTVPDFALPGDVRPEPKMKEPSVRDTIVDQPPPPDLQKAVARTVPEEGQPDRIVKPPPRHPAGEKELPPFPTPGGSPPAKVPLFPPEAPTAKPGDEQATTTMSIGPALVSAVPRLICVSTDYAGREFALTREELIIGRVEDNDIVIEHRSVSRNHAKILFDGTTHKIVDLQSANGILVNGEEYAITDLRMGDLIELGHVRFRFVSAGEDFVPTDEEAREMLEAGVEPPTVPKKEEAAGLAAMELPAEVVGGYDPSTAQTVTDQPLSAFAMQEIPAPMVQAEPPPARPPRATEDQKPTELNQVSARAATAPLPPKMITPPPVATPSDPYSRQDEISILADPPEAAKSNTMLIGLAVLAGALLIAIVALFVGREGPVQRVEIEQLILNGQEDEAKALCTSSERDIAGDAVQFCADLLKQSALDAKNSELAVADPVVEDGEPAEVVDTVETVEAESEVVAEDPPPAEVVAPPPRKTVRKRRVRKRNPGVKQLSQREAKEVLQLGTRKFMQARYKEALSYYSRCQSVLPECMRGMGAAHAGLDNGPLAIKHYRRYLQASPNAPDAARVRGEIRKYENGLKAEQ